MTATATRGRLAKIKDETDYYDHQVDGTRDMARMGSVLNADDMGLGKSLQALTVIAIDFEMGKADRGLIVAPATLKSNWHNDDPNDLGEIQKFTHFTSEILEGTPKQRVKQLEEFSADLLVVNYEQVRAHWGQLNTMNFQVVVFDEAHYLKNPKAARTKACHKLKGKRFILLTGSPVLNHVNELWSLLYRIAPGEYPRYWTFLQRYAVFGGYKDKEIVGVKNQRELRERLHAVMIRRKFDDVFSREEDERPLYIPVEVDLCADQKALYKQAVEELEIDLPGEPTPMELENALTKFLRLKQICGTTATIPGYPDRSAKLDEAVERALQIIQGQGERLVLFTQFRGVLGCLTARLGAEGIHCYPLHGDTPVGERRGVISRWAQDDEPGALVAMLQVAGVGLNMTAASKVFMIDKLFVPKLNGQAVSRLDRIGQTKRVQVFEFICRNTIEQRVELILKRKTKVFGELVEENDSEWKRQLMKALLERESTE